MLYSLEAGSIVHAICFSPNRYWLCAATEGSIKIWDLESKLLISDLKVDSKQESEMAKDDTVQTGSGTIKVVENIARKFGVSKGKLLDRESDDLAVRIALGETQVIAETKKALSSAGVNVSSLEQFAAGKTDGLKRSNHVILVKNLPYGSSESELSDTFGKFGSLDKIILPPTKTLALVIFLEPAEARAAFRGLSYKRYKDGPLYLEWAPGNILSQTSTVGDDKVVGEVDVNRALLKQQLEEPTEADVDPDRIVFSEK